MTLEERARTLTLSFDNGPFPDVTPGVLEALDAARATRPPEMRYCARMTASGTRAAHSDAVLAALASVLSAAYVVIVCFRPTGTVDLWWTLAVGDYIRAEADVPRTALWTIDAVRDLPYVCHGWLAALAFSEVGATFGLDAVPAVPTAIALAVFGVMVATSRRLGASWLLSVAIADLVLYIVSLRMIARAEVFAYLWFALALNRIAAYMRGGRDRDLAWLVPIAALWVNSHGLVPAAARPARAHGRRPRARRVALCAISPRCAGPRARSRAAPRPSARSRCSPRSPRSRTRTASTSSGTCSNRPAPTRSRASSRSGSRLDASGGSRCASSLPAILLAGAIAYGFRRLSFVSMLFAAALAVLAVSAGRHIAFFGIGAAFAFGDYAAGLALGRHTRTALAAALAVALLAANTFAATTLGFADRSLAAHPSNCIMPALGSPSCASTCAATSSTPTTWAAC